MRLEHDKLADVAVALARRLDKLGDNPSTLDLFTAMQHLKSCVMAVEEQDPGFIPLALRHIFIGEEDDGR